MWSTGNHVLLRPADGSESPSKDDGFGLVLLVFRPMSGPTARVPFVVKLNIDVVGGLLARGKYIYGLPTFPWPASLMTT